MSLTGKTLANSYKDILQVDNSNNGVDTTLRIVKDGEGTQSALKLCDDAVAILPVNDNGTATFNVFNNSGSQVLTVDTTNQLVYASGNIVNTQYANFSIGSSESANFIDDTHQAIPFSSANYATAGSGHIPAFGTGTDPATTFTTAEGNGTRASDIVPVMWYVPDAISIDSVTSIEGADSATGDVSRMHLFSYTFTSGSTSCLTSGTLLAHNSDVTNAGSEQAYLTSWTVDSAAVTAGKVILAFFKSDSVNSAYSVNIRIEYHLT